MEKHLSFKKVSLHTPQLEQLSQVLSDGLKLFFEYVQVSVVQCPNLQLSPFNLAQIGLSGNEKIVDVGGPPYLVPTPNKNKKFSFEKIAELIGMSNVSLIGPCAGPHDVIGSNSEMVANLFIEKDNSNQLKITNKSRYAKVDENGSFELSKINCSKFSFLANLYASEGLTGPVLKIVVKKRISDDNFTNSIRKVINEKYGTKPVSLGGVFVIKSGKANIQIMPDFAKTPLMTDEQLNNWLKFYEMNSPLTCLSVFHSYDPGYDLRMEHTHCFSEHGEGGHYHYDVTPDHVEYEGYFNVAKQLYRVDAPVFNGKRG